MERLICFALTWVFLKFYVILSCVLLLGKHLRRQRGFERRCEHAPLCAEAQQEFKRQGPNLMAQWPRSFCFLRRPARVSQAIVLPYVA
ncbi:hypothetical protein N9X46_05425 [Paracoccaceae bacterium]|nr:hypothetical protein [Paracoccaceae bacterium]